MRAHIDERKNLYFYRIGKSSSSKTRAINKSVIQLWIISVCEIFLRLHCRRCTFLLRTFPFLKKKITIRWKEFTSFSLNWSFFFLVLLCRVHSTIALKNKFNSRVAKKRDREYACMTETIQSPKLDEIENRVNALYFRFKWNQVDTQAAQNRPYINEWNSVANIRFVVESARQTLQAAVARIRSSFSTKHGFIMCFWISFIRLNCVRSHIHAGSEYITGVGIFMWRWRSLKREMGKIPHVCARFNCLRTRTMKIISENHTQAQIHYWTLNTFHVCQAKRYISFSSRWAIRATKTHTIKWHSKNVFVG